MKNNRVTVASLVVSASVLVTIAGNEGFVDHAYRDVVGVPTIGYGETDGVKMGQVTTPQRALLDLERSADAHAKGMAACIDVPVSQNEFDAYLDFTYNVGVSAFCGSTLARKLNAKDYAGACAELLRWDRAGGRVIPALHKRRLQEFQTCTGETKA
jgi:lysozyme